MRRLLLLVLCCLVLGASGCALGPYGLQAARYTRTETATVMEVYSFGGTLRTLDEDRGATLGFRKSAYVYEREKLSGNAIGQEWRFFYTPNLAGAPVCRASTSVGVELQATPEISRLGLGVLDQVISVGPALGESRIVSFSYDRRNPAVTAVYISHNLQEEKQTHEKESN